MKKLVFKNVEFIKSCAEESKSPHLKDDQGEFLFEVAVAGRSNVGKSSLLNHLFKSKDLVKTSQKPGKTRLLNFFKVDENAIFCDLPGYGFASVSDKMQDQWQKMIEPYIEKRATLKLILLLLDIRRVPSEQDLQFFHWIRYHQKVILVIFTKVDKVTKNERTAQIKKNLEKLNAFDIPFVCYSTTKNIGRRELIFEINKAMQ